MSDPTDRATIHVIITRRGKKFSLYTENKKDLYYTTDLEAARKEARRLDASGDYSEVQLKSVTGPPAYTEKEVASATSETWDETSKEGKHA